jgi:pyruvate formate lyase activating enzyme
VAVTAGYIHAAPRAEFYAHMDAANVDLKAFSEEFYFRLTGAHLAPVLETLKYLVHETDCWTEITTLLIPARNDSDAEIRAMCRWIARELRPDVPLHFTAFHPDYKLADVPRTPGATLSRARRIAHEEGLQHVYTGNVHDREGGTTSCARCHAVLIERDWHRVLRYELTDDGRCPHCLARLAGRFEPYRGSFGNRRFAVKLAR